MYIEPESWSAAAVAASNLSELELTLGEVPSAISDAECSVGYADSSGDAFLRMSKRAKHAEALHQSGRLSEAESLFREAERMQAVHQPVYPLLYSLRGFQYCDLLLAATEREAWRSTLGWARLSPSYKEDSNTRPDALEAYHAVTKRVAQTLKWAEIDGNLLDIALDHLTLSRATLYEAILTQSEIKNQQSKFDHAVSSLRRAGHMDDLPRGLLTRAWYRSLLNRQTGPDSAQSDLDEAWEIASRGPMPLHMADIRLHRARLFFDVDEYPWESVERDLSEARRLIEKHGYGRRMEELEDAEEALLS